MITNLKIASLKGVTGTYKLGPLNLIVGPNGTGKSAITDAIILALCGRHPEHGSRAGALMDALASSPRLLVETEHTTDNPHCPTSRRITLARKGAGATMTAEPDGKFYPLHFAALTEWLSLTGPARAQFVFSRAKVDPETFNIGRVVSVVRSLTSSGEAEAEVVTEIVQKVEHSYASKGEDNIQTWLAKLIEQLREDALNWKRRADDLAGSFRVSTENAAENFLTALPTPVAKEELEAAQTKVRETSRAVGALMNQLREAKAAVDRRAAIARKVDELTTKVTDATAECEELAGMEESAAATIVKLKEELAALADPTQALSDLLKERTAKGRVLLEAGVNSELYQRELDRHVLETEQMLKNDRCPTCNCAGDIWKTSFKEQRDARTQELTEKRDRALADKEQAADDIRGLDALEASYRNVEERRKELVDEISEEESTIQSVRKKLARLEELKKQLSDYTEHTSATVLTEPSAEELAAARKAADDANEELQRLSDRHTAYRAAEAARETENQNQLKLAKTEAAKSVYKLAHKALVDLQAVLTEATVGQLLLTARELTAGIVPWLLEYKEGEFGYNRKGTWVPMGSFSGAERRLAFAGIQLAFSTELPERILILDELGTLHPEWQEPLAERVKDLLKRGVIHQFIGLAPELPEAFRGDSGVNLIIVPRGAL